MKVTLRQKPFSNGTKLRYYLDIYRSKNERYKETLKLWSYVNPDKNKRTHNKNVKEVAEKVLAERIIELQNGFYGIKSSKSKFTDFVHYFESLTKKREQTGINFNHWYSTYKHLKEYSILTKNRPTFLQINKEWLEDFKIYLLSRITQNSAASYFNILRHGVHEAIRDRLITNDPLRYVQSPKTVEAIRDYLTIEELNMLAQTPCKDELYKRVFLFGCLTGLRISDMIKLKWSEVNFTDEIGWHIIYTQKKTQKKDLLQINQQARHFMGEKQSDNKLVFDGLTYSDTKNRMLKHWALDAGIRKPVTFHIARHTFATLQLTSGTDIYTVSKLLGHTKVSTTQIYGKIIDATKRKAVDSLPAINVSFNL
jgi:site-specific recombinase XerD